MTTVTELLVAEFLDLAPHSGLDTELRELTKHSGDINPFYEEWMLLPALRTLGAGFDLRVVLIRDSSHRLIAVFPFERVRHPRIPIVRVLKLWRHKYCFLCTPLIDARHVLDAAEAFARWLESGSASAPLVQFHSCGIDGPFGDAFLPLITHRSGWVSDSGVATRALLRRGTDWHARISSKHVKELMRIGRRLREIGRVEYAVLGRDDDCARWIEQFLAIESSGWKGRSGTAIDSTGRHRDFFREIAMEAHRRGRLQLMRMTLNDQPIAMKCNFLALPGSFAFKIAFDESYRKYSPGLLLELFNMEHLASHCSEVQWMDSCAEPGHYMMERLWPDRRAIGSHDAAGRGLVARSMLLAAPSYRLLKGVAPVYPVIDLLPALSTGSL